MPVVHQDGFSTAVRITLDVGGDCLRVSQVGEDSLILRDDLPQNDNAGAALVIMVDGRCRVHPVVIKEQHGKLVYFRDADRLAVEAHARSPLPTPTP